MNASIIQIICSIIIFLGAIITAVCNHYKDMQPAAQTTRLGWGDWRAWIARNASRIILCSAVVIAIGIVCISISGEIASRASSERLSEQIRELQQANESLTAQERQRQAVVAVSDFYRMLRNYDTHFKEKSFDSAMFNLSKYSGMRSGEYIKCMIEFAEDARRKRDNLIDSASVRLTQLDVNTDTLRFERRLPVRMGRALRWSAKAAGFDGSAMNRVLQCDTL